MHGVDGENPGAKRVARLVVAADFACELRIGDVARIPAAIHVDALRNYLHDAPPDQIALRKGHLLQERVGQKLPDAEFQNAALPVEPFDFHPERVAVTVVFPDAENRQPAQLLAAQGHDDSVVVDEEGRIHHVVRRHFERVALRKPDAFPVGRIFVFGQSERQASRVGIDRRYLGFDLAAGTEEVGEVLDAAPDGVVKREPPRIIVIGHFGGELLRDEFAQRHVEFLARADVVERPRVVDHVAQARLESQFARHQVGDNRFDLFARAVGRRRTSGPLPGQVAGEDHAAQRRHFDALDGELLGHFPRRGPHVGDPDAVRFADAQRHVRRRNAFGIAEAQREGEVFVVDLQDHRRKPLTRNERRGRFAPCQLPARHDAGITGRVDCERPVVTDRNDRAFHRAVLPESGFHPRAGQDFHEREAKASLLPVDGFATDGHPVARNERRTQSRGETFDQARIAGVFDRRLLSAAPDYFGDDRIVVRHRAVKPRIGLQPADAEPRNSALLQSFDHGLDLSARRVAGRQVTFAQPEGRGPGRIPEKHRSFRVVALHHHEFLGDARDPGGEARSRDERNGGPGQQSPPAEAAEAAGGVVIQMADPQPLAFVVERAGRVDDSPDDLLPGDESEAPFARTEDMDALFGAALHLHFGPGSVAECVGELRARLRQQPALSGVEPGDIKPETAVCRQLVGCDGLQPRLSGEDRRVAGRKP